MQKDLLKKKPHPHRQPMKRLNSGTVIIKEEPKQRRREPIIKILLKEDEGNNNLSQTLIHSFIVAALIKEWTKQSKIFEPSKSRCYEKHVIQQIIRFDKKDTKNVFLNHCFYLWRLILFTNPLSAESKGRIKYEMENRANKFIERLPYFQSLSSIDRDTV